MHLPYSITVITDPSEEPVTTAEAKAQANIDANLGDDDTLLNSFIKAARRAAEKYTGKTFIDTIYELRINQFPVNDGKIFFPRFPVSAIKTSEFKYVDTDGNIQVWDTANFTLFDKPVRPYVMNAFEVSYPDTRNTPEAVRIQFTAGYGATGANVPGTIKQAILIAVSHMYRFRDGAEIRGSLINTPLPVAFYVLLDNEILESI